MSQVRGREIDKPMFCLTCGKLLKNIGITYFKEESVTEMDTGILICINRECEHMGHLTTAHRTRPWITWRSTTDV
jgi:hypothetical protein